MRQALTAAPVVLVLIAGGLNNRSTAPRASARPDGAVAPVVSVAVIDYADAMPAVVDLAEQQAARIFRQTGIRTVWQDATPRPGGRPANPPPDGALQGFIVQMIIQPRAPGRGKEPGFLMGAAPETQRDCGGAIYLFYDRILDTARLHQLNVALVMGHVIAHELAHRVLFRKPHSTEGLMRSPWNASDFQNAALGLLLFSASDAEAIRHTASMCRDSLDPSAWQSRGVSQAPEASEVCRRERESRLI